MCYPGKIKAGTVSKKAFCTIDFLPTIAKLAGAALPKNPIDGLDVWPLITGANGATNPHEYYAFATGTAFDGVMTGDGKWKLHVPHKYRQLVKPGNDGAAGQYRQTEIGLSLYDMEKDPFETTNLLEKQPRMAARLQAFAADHQKQFYPAP